MKRILAILAILYFASQSCVKGGSSPWSGTYKPVSNACAGSDLKLAEQTFSYNDCNSVKIQPLVDSDHEFSFAVSQVPECSWSRWIISIRAKAKSSGPEVNVTGYERLNDFHAGRYTFDCDYIKQ
jgi:hypothetical protein